MIAFLRDVAASALGTLLALAVGLYGMRAWSWWRDDAWPGLRLRWARRGYRGR